MWEIHKERLYVTLIKTLVRVIKELARHRDLATSQRHIDVSVDRLRNAVDLVGL